MKSFKLFPVLLFLTACGSGIPKYDATGTFEATDVIVSAEATGKILTLDVEEGTTNSQLRTPPCRTVTKV